ncbi:hypothetical protein [Brevundimonas sp. FT23042]|uniref:hypothetical protein n=1 Tax=Brevundimonas sp. FT23042 TaxID=3393749 RepID=UPI003B5890F6
MLRRKIVVAMGLACGLLAGTGAASAQDLNARYSDYSAPGTATDRVGVTVTRDNTSGSRLPRQLEEERRQADRRRRAERGGALAPSGVSSAEVLAAARTVATDAGIDCQMTEASNPGVVTGETPVYEAVCANGPGYVLIASSPPQSYDCFDLAGTAATARMSNPRANVGLQCEMPANQNSLEVIGGWARQAGVTCQVSNAVAVGKSVDDNSIYEIGCSDQEGFWLERSNNNWLVQRCSQVAAAGDRCRFTASRD